MRAGFVCGFDAPAYYPAKATEFASGLGTRTPDQGRVCTAAP